MTYDYQEPHYTLHYEEKETEECPGSVCLTQKPKQPYGLIFEEDADADKYFKKYNMIMHHLESWQLTTSFKFSFH